MDYLTYLTTYPHLYQAFSALIERTPNLCRYIRDQQLFENDKCFFSIGAGEGDLELALAREYNSRFEFLEPASLFVESFERFVKEQQLSDRVMNIHQQSFEDYVSGDLFDYVLSIHSWYSFGFNRLLLKKALSMLKPGGRLLINLMSKQSPVYGLSNMSYSSGIDLCAEGLSEWAEKEGFIHQFSLETAARPAELFFTTGGDVTSEAKDFASFLIARPWNELSEKEKNKATNIFELHRSGDTVNIVSGCLLFTAEG